MDESLEHAPSVRLDVWLWAARWFKTRALAKKAIASNQIKIDGQSVKPSRALRGGECLHIERSSELYEVTVTGIASKRGSVAVAQTLYEESEASKEARLQARALRSAAAQGYQPPKTKPDKRARRLIKALGDLDAF